MTPPCRKPGADPELWFPVGVSGPALVQREKAMALCRQCPALTACREYAYDHRLSIVDGVWGALDFALERRHLPGAAYPSTRSRVA